ncbi:helix-turn-helix domain-containing protein [bacterium]|nr:helix-turn-helix domain-containing protein [bacterium]
MKHFTTKQTATFLGYNDDSYIRKLIATGKLEAEKIGRQLMISEEAIHKYRVAIGIKSKFKQLLAVHQELAKLISEVMTREQAITGPKDAILSFALTKMSKSHEAILVLTSQGFGEDATILSRSLFELMVNIAYIQNDSSDSLANRYLDYDWVQRAKMIENVKEETISQEATKRGITEAELKKQISDLRIKAEEVKRKYNYTNNAWSDLSLFDMSDKIGRLDAYKTVYRLQCQLAHNSSRSMNDYLNFEEIETVFDASRSDNWIEECLVITFDFAYHILSAFNEHFKTGFDENIANLEHQFVENFTQQ